MPHVYRSGVDTDRKDDRPHKYVVVWDFAVGTVTGDMLLAL